MSVPTPAETPVLHVTDLDVARRFHVHTLGCTPVRGTAEQLELELFGQPLTLVVGDVANAGTTSANASFVLGVDDWCTTLRTPPGA